MRQCPRGQSYLQCGFPLSSMSLSDSRKIQIMLRARPSIPQTQALKKSPLTKMSRKCSRQTHQQLLRPMVPTHLKPTAICIDLISLIDRVRTRPSRQAQAIQRAPRNPRYHLRADGTRGCRASVPSFLLIQTHSPPFRELRRRPLQSPHH